MALKNRCVACDYVIEAPESMRGQETVCPKCEAPNVLLAPDEAALAVEEDRRRSDADRRRFMTELNRPSGRGPVAVDVDVLPARERAALAGGRLKDVSDYTLAFAYVLGAFAVALGVVLAWAADVGWHVRAFAVLAGAFSGLLVFLFFKFMSDAFRALADLADVARAIDARLATPLARDPLTGGRAELYAQGSRGLHAEPSAMGREGPPGAHAQGGRGGPPEAYAQGGRGGPPEPP